MGFKGFTSNRKRQTKASKSNKWHRALKAEKKKQLPAESLEIEDVHLFSKEKLKNKLKNPKNNIKITGKKKRRLTKRLGHALREKSQMDVEVDDSKHSKKTSQHKKQDDIGDAIEEDAVMEQEGGVEDDQIKDGLAMDGTQASAEKTRRRRKRGGKKHKKKESDGNVDEEDVEMDEDL